MSRIVHSSGRSNVRGDRVDAMPLAASTTGDGPFTREATWAVGWDATGRRNRVPQAREVHVT